MNSHDLAPAAPHARPPRDDLASFRPRPALRGFLAGTAATLLALGLLAAPASRASAQTQSDGLLGVGKAAAEVDDGLRAKITRLEKQVPMTSTNYRGHYDLANAYQDAGMQADAEARYRRCLEINPGFTEAKVNLGGLLTDMSRFEDAIALFEEALAEDPEDCKARSNLGNAYYSMARYPDAMYEYQRAVEIDPKCFPALYNIGVAFADAGIFREAVKWWTRVVEVAPGTEAGRQARDNIELLQPLVQSPVPAPRRIEDH